jgi:hypothetical protein
MLENKWVHFMLISLSWYYDPARINVCLFQLLWGVYSASHPMLGTKGPLEEEKERLSLFITPYLMDSSKRKQSPCARYDSNFSSLAQSPSSQEDIAPERQRGTANFHWSHGKQPRSRKVPQLAWISHRHWKEMKRPLFPEHSHSFYSHYRQE